MILETKWNRLEIFCYGDKSHIRVQPHMKYYLGAAKLVVTGGKNVIFWIFGAKNERSPQVYKYDAIKSSDGTI